MKPASIEREIQRIGGRLRRRWLWRNLTLVWLMLLAVSWLALVVARHNGQPWPGKTLMLATVVGGALALVVSLLRRFDLRQVARQIEQVHPDLETKLLAAYERELGSPAGQRGFLDEAVIQQARVHSLTHDRWSRTVPSRQLLAWAGVQWMALALLVATLWIHSRSSGAPDSFASTGAAGDIAARETLAVTVEPGDVELERGADLLVLARFADPDKLPREVVLLTTSVAGDQRHALQQSLSDPVFAVRIPEVKHDLAYRLAFGAQQTREYRVTVFDYPELDRADVELRYPSYTGLPPRRVEDVRQLSVLEGTEVRLMCRLNKPVASARLAPGEGAPIALESSPEDKTLYVATRTMVESVRWRLELTDERARTNRQSVDFVIDVVPNRPPDLKLVFPKQDLKVSPLQEVTIEAEVMDDFGVVRWGLAYELTGKKSQSVTLGEKLPGKEKHSGRRLVALEELQARPDELLAWHAWAEDLGPDGKLRRTTSDIFFAEVSPFEEIFREMSSDGGQPGQGQPNPVDQVAKLQKEIISATWNLRRREQAAAPTSKYAADAQTIADSQQKAIEQLQEMKEKLRSPEAAATVAEIETQMQAAHRALAAAADGNVVPPLDDALPAEQAAYQGLLKLRARETRITRSRNSQAGGGQQSASGQNLDQLELSNEEERYETRNRAADARQTPAQKEREEFLSRLRELARRQEDMNQKIKELQAALDAARNEEEKKQIERQLKRLRDEQRDLLRDVDQLKNNVDKPQHNQPQAEASRQLEATRENVRQASDALEKGQMPQALAAGTRAESELDKLREDFRKQNANQFTDEVRDLLDKARELDQRQQQIGQQLGADPKETGKPTAKPGLRPTVEPSKLPEEIAEQRKELGEVLDKAREITERAEGSEPLLSKQLYDTIRQAHQQQTPRAVELMQQLVDNGLAREAAKIAPQATQGVRKLREGIEKAAEGVLGNDVESLRRAKREVDRLAQALADEIARENPAAAPRQSPSTPAGDATKNDATKQGTPSSDAPKTKQDQKQSDKGNAQPSRDSDKNQTSPGQQPGEGKPANDEQPGKQGQPMGQGQQPGSPQQPGGNQPGQTQQPGQQPGQSQQSGQGQQPAQGQQSGQGQQPGRGQQPGLRQQPTTPSNPQPGQPGEGNTPPTGNEAGTGPHGVITGADWRDWSDALRNIEEFVPGTRLRSEAARVREQAQALRAEARRHSKAPNWDLVRESVYEPLVELQRQLHEELLRRASPEAVVPLDRDPVPDRFSDAVRRYYERLGSGQ